MKKSLISITTAVLILFLGVFLQWKFGLLTRIVSIKTSNVETGVNSVEKSLSTLTIIKLTEKCNIYVVINPDSIWFDPFENLCNNNPSLSIDKEQYPNLFKQGVADSSFISVEKDTNTDSTLIISNNQPDHGGYSPVYQLVINIKTGEITEKK